MQIFKKNKKLDTAIDKVAALLEKRDAADKGLKEAQAAFDKAVADNKNPDVDAVTSAQLRLNSLVRLIETAKSEAVAAIKELSATANDDLEKTAASIDELRRTIGRRQVEACCKFAAAHGLKMRCPGERSAGSITLPSVPITLTEAQEIQQATQVEPNVDQDAAKLKDLLAEKQRLLTIKSSTPEVVLSGLLRVRG